MIQGISFIEYKNISGIYRIVNITNGDSYIGSAKYLAIRNSQHHSKLLEDNHPNKKLQHAWNKYGESNFKFEILAKCPIEYLIKLEQWFIDHINSYYNIRREANSNIGLRWTEEHKRKIGESQKGKELSEECKEKISEANQGKRRSKEFREFMSNLKKGKPSPHSIEYLNEIGRRGREQARLINSKKVKCVTTDEIYNSLEEASNDLGIIATSIGKVANRKQLTAGGLEFVWV